MKPLDPIYTELRQGHRIEIDGEWYRIVNAKGDLVDRTSFEPSAIQSLIDHRQTWLDGFCAALDGSDKPLEIAFG